MIGNGDDDQEFVRGMGCHLAESLDQADFLLARGSFTIDFASSSEAFSKDRRLHSDPVFLDLAKQAAARCVYMAWKGKGDGAEAMEAGPVYDLPYILLGWLSRQERKEGTTNNITVVAVLSLSGLGHMHRTHILL